MAYVMDMEFEDINKIKTLEQIKVAREKKEIIKQINLLQSKLAKL